MLTDLQIIDLNRAYLASPEFKGNTDNFKHIVEWAENIQPGDEIGEALFSLVMKGLIAIGWDDDNGQVYFSATEKGRNHPQLYQGELND